ncbi:MAG: hypothetical protein WCT28_00415 [Patescibacteria group bacterium]|jgi:hypothetical protein
MIVQKFDYRDPSSIPQKKMFIHIAFGDAIPQILFYNSQNSEPSKQDLTMIGRAFFPSGTELYGRVLTIPHDPAEGRPPRRGLKSFNVICVIHPSAIHYEFTLEDGRTCHLLQASSEMLGSINFMDLWGPSPQDPMGEVDLSGLNVDVIVMAHGEGGLVPTERFNNFASVDNVRTPEPKGPSPSEPPRANWFARMIAWILVGTG